MEAEATAIQHVADRFMMRLAAQEACRATSGSKVASDGLTPEVVAVFAEHFYLPQHTGRVAFASLVRKLKQLVDGFKRLPKLWERFKEVLGVESLLDLPGAIKRLAESVTKVFRSAITKLFNHWPLKIYTLEKGKLFSFNQMLEGLLDHAPRFKQFLSQAVAKVGDFGEMIRQYAPHIVGVVMVGIYIWVWLNVVEFEWDLKALVDAVSGALTFPEFLATLPGSAFGFLLNGFGIGTFTLLPYLVVARILYLVAHRYIEWTSQGFRVDWNKMVADFKLDPALVTLARR